MMVYKILFSLRVNLDDIISDSSIEKKFLEKISTCRKVVGDEFKLILWNKNLTENEVKSFVKRNHEKLFDYNTSITKENSSRAWFVIDNSYSDNSNYRYKFVGNIFKGLKEYLNITNHIKGRDRK